MAKSEREKMLAGEIYNSRDPELLELYHLARQRLAAFHAAESRDTDGRRACLQALLGTLAPGVWVEPPFYCDYGIFIHLGRGTFLNGGCYLLDNNHIHIGADCLLGPNVQIYTATHPLPAGERIVGQAAGRTGEAPYRTYTRPVFIEDRVWIGGNVVVLPGLRIGRESVVAAGSVVTRDIPPGVVAAGNPCRVIRSLT